MTQGQVQPELTWLVYVIVGIDESITPQGWVHGLATYINPLVGGGGGEGGRRKKKRGKKKKRRKK